jgi:hypothetical protein
MSGPSPFFYAQAQKTAFTAFSAVWVRSAEKDIWREYFLRKSTKNKNDGILTLPRAGNLVLVLL